MEKVQLNSNLRFINTGCTLLNCVLGGGYAIGKIINVVGDRATGKSLLAIEAVPNFLESFPNGMVKYIETEEAFDPQYVEALGVPPNRIRLERDIQTVEQWYNDITETMEKCAKENIPCLYILDSLDALSDDAEAKEKIGASSYGVAKPRMLSKIFRLIIKNISYSNTTVIIVSQVREKIGVVFGEPHTRSGGKALDFYASQIFWLYEKGKIKKVIGGVERATGVNIHVRNKKNRMGSPYRECDFQIQFGYGVDDLVSCLDWLITVSGEEPVLGYTKNNVKVRISALLKKGQEDVLMETAKVQELVRQTWAEVEARFAPKLKKY